jgi:hypothetical protein
MNKKKINHITKQRIGQLNKILNLKLKILRIKLSKKKTNFIKYHKGILNKNQIMKIFKEIQK